VVHPDYLLDQLTSRQISEWEAYDRIDPIGTWREDFRLAKIESLITNIVQQLYAKKGSKPAITSPIDFMVDWTGDKVAEPKKQSTQEMKDILLGIASSQNKKVKGLDRPPVKKTNRK
jgi:hypothetical protein